MFLYFLKITIRNIFRNKIFSVINITGLAIALASSFLILHYVLNELSYDKHNIKGANIYRLISYENRGPQGIESMPRVPFELGPKLERDYPEVIRMVRIKSDLHEPVFIKKGVDFIEENLFCCADKGLFDIFTIPLIKGQPGQLLNDPQSIVITETMAKKYFADNENPLGKTLTISRNQSLTNLTVTGIIKDFPKNSTFRADFITEFSEDINPSEVDGPPLPDICLTYVLLTDADQYPELEKKLSKLKNMQYGLEIQYSLQPLCDIYLYSENFHPVWGIQGNRKNIYVYSLIGLLIILVASINYIILSTARSYPRMKEIGIRKTVGAQKTNLIMQFIGESILNTFIALPIAVIITELLSPLSNILFGKEQIINYYQNWRFILGIIAVTLIVGIVSGIYLSVYLSSYKPINLLTNKMNSLSGKSYFRKNLIVIQLTLFIVLIVCMGIIYKQVRYTQQKEYGFNKENLIIIQLPYNPSSSMNYDKYKNSIQEIPGVIQISGAKLNPSTNLMVLGIVQNSEDSANPLDMEGMMVDFNYIETLGFKVLSGRSFSQKYSNDIMAVILNESAVKNLGLVNPVGKKIIINRQKREVIGVVKDFHLHSIHSKIPPIFISIFPEDWMKSQIVVRVDSKNISHTLSLLEKKWKALKTNSPFEYHFLDDEINKLYRSEKRFGESIGIFTLLAVFISSMGLFGLSMFFTQRKSKEIGVRKVFGAGVFQIVHLIFKEFISLIVIANIVAFPIAYFFMSKWLQNFAYRIDIGLNIFAFAAILSILVVFHAVSYNTIKAAIANPVAALRYE